MVADGIGHCRRSEIAKQDRRIQMGHEKQFIDLYHI